MQPLSILITMLASSLPSASGSLYEFQVKDIDGQDFDLRSLQGKVVLVVNVASQCGYTSQYAGLQRLHEQFSSEGLVVLGVPANDYGSQEPGSEAEIKAFCTGEYGVTFPMLAKLSADGAGQDPLFAFLTSAENPDHSGRISWNFEKFLVGKDGKLLRRFRSSSSPEDDEILSAVREALAR